jgi:hypothetical protein
MVANPALPLVPGRRYRSASLWTAPQSSQEPEWSTVMCWSTVVSVAAVPGAAPTDPGVGCTCVAVMAGLIAQGVASRCEWDQMGRGTGSDCGVRCGAAGSRAWPGSSAVVRIAIRVVGACFPRGVVLQQLVLRRTVGRELWPGARRPGQRVGSPASLRSSTSRRGRGRRLPAR